MQDLFHGTRRQFLRTGLGGLGLLALHPFDALGRAADDWWFVHLSDTHNGGETAAETLRFVLDDVRATFPQARFLVATGDITEHGWEEELDENLRVMEASGLTYYNVMGNHDARWSRTGRKAFTDRFGQTHWALHGDPLTVLAIDSSVLLEQYGYLDPAELRWVEAELQRLDGKPALLAFHHPPSYANHYIGSEWALYDLAARYNIPAVLAGHIHTRRERRVNGTWVLTTGATMTPSRGYSAFHVTPEALVLHHRLPEEGTTAEVLTIPFDKAARGTSAAADTQVDVARAGERLRLAVPSVLAAAPMVVEVNGLPAETTRSGDVLEIDAAGLGAGRYEVMLASPDAEAERQHRRWGLVDLPGEAAPRWTRTLPAGIQTRPAFHEGLILAGTNDGTLHALRREDGGTAWTRSLGPGALLSAPVLHDGRILMGTIDGHVHALDPDGGATRWQTAVDGAVIATGRIAGDAYVVGTGGGALYAVDPADGRVRWTFRADNLVKATPAFDGRRLYFGAWDGHFYAVDAADGTLAWKKYINTPHYSPATCNPKLHEGRVYFVSHDYRTHCLDAETGEVVWQYPAADVDFQWNSPIVADCKPSYSEAVFHDGTVFFTSLTGHVIGFDARTGARTFVEPVAAPVFDSFPLKVGDRMYFGTTHGTLYAFDLGAGRPAWTYSTGYDYIFAAPAAHDGLLAVGNLGGVLAVFDIS